MAKLVGARVTNNAHQSISNTTDTVLTFNTEKYDTDSIHDPGSNPERLTCVTAGKYVISGSVRYAANATGDRYLWIYVGATQIASVKMDAGGSGNSQLTITTQYVLAVDEYVTLNAYQDSGGALNVETSGETSPQFAMHRVG